MSTTISPLPPVQPVLSSSNIFSSPGTSLLGVGWLANMVGTQLSAGVPTSTAGWFGLAINTLIGLAGLFGRA